MSLEALPSQFTFPGWEALTSSDPPGSQCNAPQLRLLNDVPLEEPIYNREQVMSWPGMTTRPDLLEVLEMVVRGMQNKQIARELRKPLSHVKTAIHDLLQRSGADNRAELVARANQPLKDMNAQRTETHSLRAM